MSTDTPSEPTPEHDVPWLSPDQQRDWRALVALIMALPPALDAQLKRDAGVNVFEYHVLSALSDAPNRTLVLSNLAALAQGSLSRISHAITRLERSGCVERRSLPNRGGRHTEARLTDAGFAKLEEAAPHHVEGVRENLVDIADPADFAAVGRVFDAVAEKIGQR